MEQGEHQKLVLDFFKVQSLHTEEHSFHSLETQVLQYWAQFAKMFFYSFFLLKMLALGLNLLF